MSNLAFSLTNRTLSISLLRIVICLDEGASLGVCVRVTVLATEICICGLSVCTYNPTCAPAACHPTLQIEAKASCMLGRSFTTEPHTPDQLDGVSTKASCICQTQLEGPLICNLCNVALCQEVSDIWHQEAKSGKMKGTSKDDESERQ